MLTSLMHHDFPRSRYGIICGADKSISKPFLASFIKDRIRQIPSNLSSLIRINIPFLRTRTGFPPFAFRKAARHLVTS